MNFVDKMMVLTVICVVGIFAALFLAGRNTGPVATQKTSPTPALSVPNAPVVSRPTPNSIFSQSSNATGSQSADRVSNATFATIQTAKGDIVVQLYPNDAPKTVANFATLAKRGYYNNLTFHRVEPGFVIQGGDPNGDGTGGASIYGSTFEDELNPNTKSYQEGYKEGVLAMANRGPNTNGSQFFIMLADNNSLPKNYTIFGKVTSGMDVVKKIEKGDIILHIIP